MAERTPGPWKWHWRTNEDGKPECGIFAEPRDGHAYSVARCPQYQSRKKWEADAAFIVKACNSHDKLVETLRWFLEDERFRVAVGGNPNAVDRMLTEARAALAEATQ